MEQEKGRVMVRGVWKKHFLLVGRLTTRGMEGGGKVEYDSWSFHSPNSIILCAFARIVINTQKIDLVILNLQKQE